MKKAILLFALIFSVSLYGSDKTKTVSLNISGMTCQSCANTVEKALKNVDGVKEAKVDLKNNTATVVLASATMAPTGLIKAVGDAGFEASEKTTATKKEMKKKSKSDKDECGEGCCGEDEVKPAKSTKKKS